MNWLQQLRAELGDELQDLGWLFKKCRALSAAAKKHKRIRRAQAFLTFNERGRLSVRLSPEETPGDGPEEEPQG
jgi:hypothetical protein